MLEGPLTVTLAYVVVVTFPLMPIDRKKIAKSCHRGLEGTISPLTSGN